MDETYDVIVLGTGLKECILSGLFSVAGKKVLHMDRNDYYGGASASLNLEQLFTQYKEGKKAPDSLGRARDYNVDIVPKFIMASGTLVKLLLHTDVTKYLDFKVVDGSYVYKGGYISKVPATDYEALKSDLMGFLEKRRAQKFFAYCQNYDEKNTATHDGLSDLTKVPMKALYEKFGLGRDTTDFIGHALALYQNDDYLNQPAKQTLERMSLYADSLSKYQKSPYIYPLYGLGELPQGFARLSAIYGGTYMLNKPIDEIVYDDAGHVVGVKSEGETAKAPIVIGDPSYFPDKCKKVGQVVRIICILGAPIPSTNNSESCQIIIPAHQVGRKSDIYISMVSAAHNVVPKGKFVAIVGSDKETSDPIKELTPALKLLGPILEKFVVETDSYEPSADYKENGVFISKSYDSTSHFATATADVMQMFESVTGSPPDLEKKPATSNTNE